MKLNVLHNIKKVFDKYFIYLYMFDTEDSENAMSRHWPIYSNHFQPGIPEK